ncbi:MAG: pentapeptide repeat-containing protein, partial [Okeania sp. SIO2D1]|nr:pentapeptide repeat-containing protein [Okeania sp. SIO2D1]
LGANLSQLNAEYFQTYHEIKSLAQTEVKALLAEKDNRIYNLENMIVTALQRPSFYTQTYQSQGDTFMADTTKNDFSGGKFSQGVVNVDKSQGNRISGPIYANHVGGIINNYPPEQKQNLADAAVEIQQLLQQLEQNYPNATEIEKQSALAVTLQQEIKQNPTLKARLINALREGGIEALKVLFGPIGIPIEMVKGWIEAEVS